jgi:hypothetical protein
MDESGTHDGSPVVAVGAYMATPAQWRHWTADWNKAKRPIDVFHSVDSANLRNEFEGWSEVDRDAFVARLLPVLPRYRLRGQVVGINLNDYEDAMRGRDDLRRLLGTPYTACFHWSVAEILLSEPKNRRIAFFHETNNFRGEALESFASIQRDHKATHRTSLTFGTKQQFTPLQAADVLAFEGNKRLRGPLERTPRRAWIALDNANGEARCSIKYFNRENLEWMVERLENIRAYNAGLITDVPDLLSGLPFAWKQR